MQFSTVDPQQSATASQQQVTPSSSEAWTAQTITGRLGIKFVYSYKTYSLIKILLICV